MTKKPFLLIIEDDKLLVEAMRDKFEAIGFRVRIAVDGELALIALKKNVPQVVLLDLLLPKRNGFDVLTEMQNNPKLKDVPVVIASNLNSTADIEKGFALGAGDYVVKSNLSLNDLANKIIFLLNKSSHGKIFLASIGKTKFSPMSQ